MLAGAVVVVLVVISNAALLASAARSAQTADWRWLVAAVSAMGLSYLASAIGIVGAAQRRVSVRRTVAAEFAGTFCNRLTPAGLGRTALRVRYLACAGLTVERAATTVAISSVVGGLAYLLGMGAAGMDLRSVAAGIVVSPGRLAIFLGSVALLAVIVAGVVTSTRWSEWRHRQVIVAHLRTLIRELRELLHDRWAVAAMLVGPLLSSLGYIVAFWCALSAVGVHLSLTTAAVVYISATAVATAVPVPGGVGAVELTLAAALSAAGVAPGLALSGVLIFRLASLWLPSAVGFVALIWLRRVGALTTAATADATPPRVLDRAPSMPLTLVISNEPPPVPRLAA
jgi:uncharacterized protein (TIRG00374 family)